jgi:PPOX class probable F420-dependent enzyme
MITDEKYVLFTTFTRAGVAKALPVWIADLGDGTCGFTTGHDSWKVKRLSNNSRVELRPCDVRGRISQTSEMISGTAKVVIDDDLTRVEKAIRMKYGLVAWFLLVPNWFRKTITKKPVKSCGIVISSTN